MTFTKHHIYLLGIFMLSLFGCGSVPNIISTPIENIDSVPIKVTELTENEKHTWGHLDLTKDTIPGMSVNRAYSEILKDKSATTTVVAVIDAGIDITHDDLDGVIWVNKKEVPNNRKDDDNNGYIDDIHGWNFLGDAYDEQLEFTRILATGNTNNPFYDEALKEYNKQYEEYSGYKMQYDQIYNQLVATETALNNHFGRTDYTLADIKAIKTEDKTLANYKGFALYITETTNKENLTDVKSSLKEALSQINNRLNTNLNKNFKGRKTGDNINDLTDTNYGNNNVLPSIKDENHGTHVTGIIAAERNNGIGVNGVANNVKIMAIRAVPGGDEYDKDIALAIRYAVDNGAKIINTSFGKYFSPHSDWVFDAIKYAAKNDVLIVNAAGNEGLDLDKKDVYPNDTKGTNPEISDTFISVGALTPNYGDQLVADFSNYGKINVDIFAPGAKIYSTTPENEYDTFGGTSMAAPAVSGIAALIRSQFPKLKAAQVKQIILDSGLPINRSVIVGGDPDNILPFSELSKTGKIANAYNALILASKVAQ